RLRDQIRAIQTELGITTVFVTHDQEEALAVSDRVAVMEEGRIAQLGTPEELYRRPATPFVADFVGLSNHLDGEAASDGVLVRGAALPLIAKNVAAGSAVTAYVRPEHVRLTAAPATSSGALIATVISSGFLGAIRRTVVQFDDGVSLAAQHGAESAFAAGDRVEVSFVPEPVTVAPR